MKTEGKQQLSDWRESTVDANAKLDGEFLKFLLRRLVRVEDRTQLEATGFSCHSDLHSEMCVANKPVRINTNGMALNLYVSSTEIQPRVNRIIWPYARKDDERAMKKVTPVQILDGNSNPPACDFTHNIPAIVFSTGGFTGNLFHEFNEIIIPLFITSRQFQSRLRFVITDFKKQWVSKYNRILTHLSPYQAINPVENGRVHCFPGAVIGLKYHDNLALNATDIPGGYSMFDFKQFLKEVYGLKISKALEIEKPVLILISRQKTRLFLNENEMVATMEELGFEVIVTMPNRMSNFDRFANEVNSCSVMVGALGAGLTNVVFLPSEAVMVQVVPLGLDWASANYFSGPASEMGVQSLEYKIEPEESSLLDLYGRDHPVITEPGSMIFSKGYDAFRAVYVDGQNFKINLVRFRETLVEARKLLGHSAPSN